MERLVGKTGHVSATSPSEEEQQVLRQGDQIVGPFPQWRDFDLDDVQAVIEIFPEATFTDGFLEIHIGSGKNPDIGVTGDIVADSFVLLVLDKAEQFGLKG
ncbi:MAG: hypothetical protein A4E66_00461 [Syntrophus sp. PtaB.Bin001]|nr:MAG: hypothetical protein A4E66_00461 [Syntrophus sp. PtaB.Bin001]